MEFNDSEKKYGISKAAHIGSRPMDPKETPIHKVTKEHLGARPLYDTLALRTANKLISQSNRNSRTYVLLGGETDKLNSSSYTDWN